MSSSSMSSARSCPECGKRNSGLSLFCSECGTPLMTDAAWAPSDATQTTTTFTPSDDPQATSTFAPSPTQAREAPTEPAWSSPATAGNWTAPQVPDVSPPVAYAPTESRRGLVLGIIATVLILLVIGFVVWASFFGEGTRDMISGWFGWIG